MLLFQQLLRLSLGMILCIRKQLEVRGKITLNIYYLHLKQSKDIKNALF